MKIPPIDSLGRFAVQNPVKDLQVKSSLSPLSKDTVSFSASTAYYLKKYKTLPDEIKKVLSPKDAIDMFKNMEFVQKGVMEGKLIGQGNYSKVYENPWLDGYYSLIVQDPKKTTQVVYSRKSLGNAIWSDKDNGLIQIIKADKSRHTEYPYGTRRNQTSIHRKNGFYGKNGKRNLERNFRKYFRRREFYGKSYTRSKSIYFKLYIFEYIKFHFQITIYHYNGNLLKITQSKKTSLFSREVFFLMLWILLS